MEVLQLSAWTDEIPPIVSHRRQVRFEEKGIRFVICGIPNANRELRIGSGRGRKMRHGAREHAVHLRTGEVHSNKLAADFEITRFQAFSCCGMIEIPDHLAEEPRPPFIGAILKSTRRSQANRHVMLIAR